MDGPAVTILRAIAADLDVDRRDLALTLLAAPVCLLGLWAGLVLLIAVGG